jgi:hypothetical protein
MIMSSCPLSFETIVVAILEYLAAGWPRSWNAYYYLGLVSVLLRKFPFSKQMALFPPLKIWAIRQAGLLFGASLWPFPSDQ